MATELTEYALPGRISPDDYRQAKADLGAHGLCLLEGALDPDRVSQLRTLIMKLAEQEIADGTDYVYEGGSNQRIWSLLRKGEAFIELAKDRPCSVSWTTCSGSASFSRISTSNIAGPGGPPMFMHADQSFLPPPWASRSSPT